MRLFFRCVVTGFREMTDAYVSFEVECSVAGFGECVAIVGGASSVGNWSVTSAVRLDGSSFPRWQGKIRLDSAVKLEYKYVILQKSGGVLWEPIDGNRVIEWTSAGGKPGDEYLRQDGLFGEKSLTPLLRQCALEPPPVAPTPPSMLSLASPEPSALATAESQATLTAQAELSRAPALVTAKQESCKASDKGTTTLPGCEAALDARLKEFEASLMAAMEERLERLLRERLPVSGGSREADVGSSAASSTETAAAQLQQMEQLLALEQQRRQQQQLEQLTARVDKLSAERCEKLTDESEPMSKVKVLLMAGMTRYEKMLKELRRQVDGMKEDLSRLPSSLPRPHVVSEMSEALSLHSGEEPKSPRSEAGGSELSFSARSTGTTWSALGEDAEAMKAEMKKVQVIVSAAGTAFAKEMKELKHKLSHYQDDVAKVKQQLAARGG
eukprot:TRINITY_DN42265_c0_g2_i1.p1 TRINITY_DN42265_c0_g2~~TRINITY_DN42265_c0_g2_i1.p1  ORF type:complete len:441 (-),score=105.97 TRINITY_DN42265_c0_g2_i1:415-1737(-)